MVGYGPEDSHFVVELTYNYGIGAYKLGNDFRVCIVYLDYIICIESMYCTKEFKIIAVLYPRGK